jgi:hypothetical protein
VSFFVSHNKQDPKSILKRMDELRTQLSSKDPATLAAHTGARLEFHAGQETRLVFHLLGEELSLRLPDYEIVSPSGPPPTELYQLLALYYFVQADGAPLSGRWISFAELPDGRFYNPAFQGYTGAELGRAFGNDLPALERAANHLNGIAQSTGDRSYTFEVLPRLPILLVYWSGDEDFPAACQLLFDDSASHYLPTDGCAITGNLLTRQLLKAGRDPL